MNLKNLLIMNNQDEYICVQKAKEIASVSSQTLRSWTEKNKIRSIRTHTNRRKYHQQDLLYLVGRTNIDTKKKKICYARVSSKNQMDNLQRQQIYLSTMYPHHIMVSDIGSGLNWKRKGLKTILEQTMRGEVEEVVVAHRDRLCRFAFELFEFIFKSTDTKLVVLDDDDEKSTEQELAEDILSIVHVYSCRSMGRRRYNAVSKNENLPNQGTEKTISRVDGD